MAEWMTQLGWHPSYQIVSWQSLHTSMSLSQGSIQGGLEFCLSAKSALESHLALFTPISLLHLHKAHLHTYVALGSASAVFGLHTILKALHQTCSHVMDQYRIRQVLENRYVDREKLVDLLERLFGVGNFQARVHYPWCCSASESCLLTALQLHLNRWILSVPQALSEVWFHSLMVLANWV